MSAMFTPALLMLIRLQWRGGFRQFGVACETITRMFQVGFVDRDDVIRRGAMYFVWTLLSGAGSMSATLDQMQSGFSHAGMFSGHMLRHFGLHGRGHRYAHRAKVASCFGTLTRTAGVVLQVLKA